MKLAQIALIAVLAFPSASYAAKIEKPGPYTLSKPQIGCQNLMDRMDVRSAQTLNQAGQLREVLARAAKATDEGHDRLCMNLPAGTKVMVRGRWISQECVSVKGTGPGQCLYIENVSGVRREDKAPDTWFPADLGFY